MPAGSSEFKGHDILDGLAQNAAVLDPEGVILDTNEAWREFGQFEGLQIPPDTIGVDYLDICDQAEEDPHAVAAASGIRAVLDGERDSFEFTYPCHSPGKKRWFRMHVGSFEQDGARHAVVTHEDVTEATVDRIQLRRRNDELEELVRVLSHDLRNPLTVASGYLDVVADATDHEAVEKIEQALERADAIISDTLDLLRTDTADLQREPVDLAEIARESWDTVETENASLSVTGSMTLDAHRGLLKHVFENLFRNAVEFGGPTVTVTVGRMSDGFFVEDDGPGIDPDIRGELFELGRTIRSGGTGFGLAIVKRYVERHGWDVSVTESDSGGARFEIRTMPALPE